MGMYDTVWQKMKCPNCKKISKIGLQTKAGRKVLANYKLGDKFSYTKKFLEYEKETVEYHAKPKYLIWLLGGCRKCRCQISGCAWINTKTYVIEEIVLHSYSVRIEPNKVFKFKGK